MGKHQSDKSVLEAVLVFRDLQPSELKEIEDVATVVEFEKGDVVFREGDPGESLYVVSYGEVAIKRSAKTGHEKILAVLGPKSFFGEMSLIDGKPRSADAVAGSRTFLVKISKSDLDALLKDHSIAAYKVVHAFARALCYRLRKMNDEILDLYRFPEKTVEEILAEREVGFFSLLGGSTQDDG